MTDKTRVLAKKEGICVDFLKKPLIMVDVTSCDYKGEHYGSVNSTDKARNQKTV